MTGNELRAALDKPPEPPVVLVQDFLYAPSVFLLTGEPGRGKSVIATQLAACLTSATPLFGMLKIPAPCGVFYAQLEGGTSEQYERLHCMEQDIPIETNHLYWYDGGRHPVSLLDASLRQRFLECIKSAFDAFPPTLKRVIILDPIYKAVYSDLAKAEPTLALIRFSDLLLHQLAATVVLIHHSHRERFDARGKRLEEADFYYGHSFLRNHVDTAYVFKPLDPDGQRGELIGTKFREEKALKRIVLCYQPETYTCTMEPLPSEDSKEAIVRQHLSDLRRNGQQTDFYQIKALSGGSPRFLRYLQAQLVLEGRLQVQKTPGKRSVWIPQ